MSRTSGARKLIVMTSSGHTKHTCTPANKRRRWGRRALLSLALLLGVGGVAYAAAPHHGWKAPSTPEEARAHAGHMAGRVLDKAQASADQRARVDQILDATAPQMWNLRGEAKDLHGELHDLLTADTIDRAAIEAARKDAVDLVDRGSKVVALALADAAEALTPEQRRTIAAAAARFHRDGPPARDGK